MLILFIGRKYVIAEATLNDCDSVFIKYGFVVLRSAEDTVVIHTLSFPGILSLSMEKEIYPLSPETQFGNLDKRRR
jgi:hypothetical protein